jgi:Phage integrase family
MDIGIIGATGNIGQRVVRAALGRDHRAGCLSSNISSDVAPEMSARTSSRGKVRTTRLAASRTIGSISSRIPPLSDVTPHVLRHSFASIANDLGFTEVTIAALVGHAKGSVTSQYIHTLDTALIMAADAISGYIQGLLDGIEFKQTAYALDRDSRKAALARFLKRASGTDSEEGEDERRLAA